MTTASDKRYKLSADEKLRIANRINYFRTMPKQVLNSAADLEHGSRAETTNFTNHEARSVYVNGKIMILSFN